MIEQLAEMPAGTVGFRVAGEVEREDYRDVLVPVLRRALDAGGGLRTLYLIEDLDEIEPGALWDDAKLGFDLGVRHHGASPANDGNSSVVAAWIAPRRSPVRVRLAPSPETR